MKMTCMDDLEYPWWGKTVKQKVILPGISEGVLI